MTTNAQTRNLPRSIAAVLVGFFACAALSLGTDQVFHVLHVYPPWDKPMYDPGLNFLALAYRCVYTVLGGSLTARLAPRNAMRHVMVLGGIGFVLSTIGAIVAITMANLGPIWYPVALVVTSIPCVWLGGVMQRARFERGVVAG